MALRSIPLPTGYRSIDGLPRQKERLYNIIPANGLLNRPGIASFTEGFGRCRGQFEYQGSLHQVSGTSLIRITQSGLITTLGSIPGAADVVAAVDFGGVALVVKGGAGYVLRDDVLTQITENYVPCVDVDVLDGIFVYIPSNGSPAIFSRVGQPDVIEVNAFFDAEVLPDLNNGVKNFNGELILMGRRSLQIFRHGFDEDAPFENVSGGALSIGYFGGKVDYRLNNQETFCFVGRDSNGGAGIFSPSGRVSTPDVDEIIQSYADEELATVIGNRLNHKGQDMLIFSFPRNTLAYNGEWFELGSGVNESPWDVRFITDIYGRCICGTSTEAIGVIGDFDTDFGQPFERFFQTFYRAARDVDFTLASLELDVVTLRGAGKVGLSTSHNGLQFGPIFWRDAPEIGRGRLQFNYPGGLGCYESFAGLRLRTTAAITFNTDALWVEDDG